MFAMKTVKDQLLDQRRENVRLKAELEKTTADVAYIAMMTDIELDTDNDETEEDENEQ